MIIAGYGVESSADIDTHDLIDLCNKFAKQAMVAIGGWLKAEGRESNAEIIKAIACRATQHSNFNRIPAERLRNLYYAFRKKQKDKESVDIIAAEYMPAKFGLNWYEKA